MATKVKPSELFFDELMELSGDDEDYYKWRWEDIHVTEGTWCDRSFGYRTHDKGIATKIGEAPRSKDWPLVLGSVVHGGMEFQFKHKFGLFEKALKRIQDYSETTNAMTEMRIQPIPLPRGFQMVGKFDYLRMVEGVGWELGDYKTIKKTFPDLTAKDFHIMQMGLYFYSINKFTSIHIDHARLIYISKESPTFAQEKKWAKEGKLWQPVMEFIVSREELLQAGEKRYKEICAIIEQDQEPERCKEGWMHNYCDWKDLVCQVSP
jgi:hypothetical protein